MDCELNLRRVDGFGFTEVHLVLRFILKLSRNLRKDILSEELLHISFLLKKLGISTAQFVFTI